MGQKIKSGTGLCDIFIDEEQLINNISEDQNFIKEEDDINILLNVQEEENCTEEDFKFSFE